MNMFKRSSLRLSKNYILQCSVNIQKKSLSKSLEKLVAELSGLGK